MASKRRYRVAVVGGAGTWGRNYLRAYADHPDCEIVALVDRARDRRQAFADRYGIGTVYDTVEDLLVQEIPDIVSIILPVGESPAAVIACAEAGVKAVSCEKPIAVELARADEMVRICRERGTALGCGTAYWEVPALLETAEWVRAGHIGRLTGAAIPGGLPREVSGAGCVQLTMMRLLTGMEAEWVEGWTLPPEPGWAWPPGAAEDEIDCPAYGRLGLSGGNTECTETTEKRSNGISGFSDRRGWKRWHPASGISGFSDSGGIVCEIPEPRPSVPCRVSVSGEDGQVWASPPRSVLIQGRGAAATPVYPEFLDAPQPGDFFTLVIERLMRAWDTGQEAQCSGHDYRQALEIAIALKLSAGRGHERIPLPLEDRSLRIFPHLYRLLGGDVFGWEKVGYKGPPRVE